MDEKIIAFDKIADFIERQRKCKGKASIVLCHGCFDIVHPGHIRHLKFAKEQGTLLVVSITPDSCVQKGSSRPYVPQDLRAENLAALEIVDKVTIAPAETGLESIAAIKPDIYIKGHEYAESQDSRFLKEKALVEKSGGKVTYSSGDVVFSSSTFIRDHDLNAADAVKLSYICDRYKINRKCLDEIIESASKIKFLIVGETILDEHNYCEGSGMTQAAPALSASLKHKKRFVGGPGSLAMHLSSFGADVSFLTSTDANSDGFSFYRNRLSDLDISMSIVEDQNRLPVIKSRFFVNNSLILELDNDSYRPLDSSLRSKILKQFKKEIKNAPDCVILSDFGYGMLSGNIIRDMTAIAHENNILVISDISMTLRTQLHKFYDSDIFIATEMELRSCMHDYESGLSVLVDSFYSQSKVKELYLTLPDESALFFKKPSKKGIHNMISAHIPCLIARHKDKQGRCEAFIAGVALARTQSANEVQSIYFGSICSSTYSMHAGNEPVSQEGIFKLLDERKELSV